MALVEGNLQQSTAMPKTVAVLNPSGKSDIVLVCEHASSFIPDGFDHLGLGAQARQSHIAWDPGALAVATKMSDLLDATLVYQNVSRLLFDCNRPPDAVSAIPEKSEVFDVPGNIGLSDAAREDRTRTFYFPFEQTLASLLDTRMARGRYPAIVTIHSFTPVFLGKPRVVRIGVLHDDDTRFADAVLAKLQETEGNSTARNQPYGPQDGVTHTLIRHGLSRRLLNVMFEIRSDLISSKNEQFAMAQLIATAVTSTLDKLHDATAGPGSGSKQE